MTPISIVAILMSFAAIGFSWSRLTTSRLLMSVMLLIIHVAASIYYYGYSLNNVADASAYYFDPIGAAAQPWQIGTVFVTKLCRMLKTQFGASYLDCFLLFQSFGFAGLMIMVRVFDEIEANIGVPERRGYWALLFLPTVNFWTSAIGKDAPIFFALSLCVWAMLSLRRRFIYFCVSLGVMVLFRAHIALLAASALAGTALFGSTISLGRKIALFATALAGIWLTSGAVQSALGVDATSVSAVSDYLDQQNAVFATVGGATSVSTDSLPIRALSLLFRPFFFDAEGTQAMIASVENIGVVIAFLYVLTHWRDLLQLLRRVPFIRFVALFAVLVLFVLTLVYYNVGLGLRQRVMAYPMIYALLVGMWSLREKYKLASAPQPPNRLPLHAKANRAAVEL
jgi:hypothetical protein